MNRPNQLSKLALSLSAAILAAITAPSCGGGASGPPPDISQSDSFVAPDGSTKLAFSDGTQVFLDESESVKEDLGSAQAMTIEEVRWGRLVSRVYSRGADGSRNLIHRNMVVDPGLLDGVLYQLRLDPFTASQCPDSRRYAMPPILERVEDPLAGDLDYHVLLTVDPITLEVEMTVGPKMNVASGVEVGCPEFERVDPQFDFHVALLAAISNLGEVAARGDSATAIGPFDKVARNAALVMRFSDLLDPTTITSETVQVFAGDPPVSPFRARTFADPNYGRFVNIDGTGRATRENFRATRIIIDFAVSSVEALGGGEINAVGLPPSTLSNKPNVSIRIPSQANFGSAQFSFLSNLTDHGVATVGNGPVDLSNPGIPVIRAFRSGSASDDGNGFLPDGTPPRLVSAIPVTITDFTATETEETFTFTATFSPEFLPCATQLRTGDLMEFGDFAAQVLEDSTAVNAGQVNQWVARARVFAPDPSLLPSNATSRTGVLLTPYISGENDIPVGCFISVSPDPGTYPVEGVSPGSSISLRFSEAMDPSSVSPLEDFMIVRTAAAPGPTDIVPGLMEVNDDLTQFTFVPSLPLSYPNRINFLDPNAYFILLGEDPNGLSDLAGNRLLAEPFDGSLRIRFGMDPTSPEDFNGGYVLRFNELNEDGADGPELVGQFVYDLDEGIIVPRPVQRFSGLIDRENPITNLMIKNVLQPGAAFPPFYNQLGLTYTIYDQDINEPLTPFGCRMMWAWRYCDMSVSTGQAPNQYMDVRDEELYNIDVEGLAWAAPNGAVQSDSFPEFGIWLAHANRFPDQGGLTPYSNTGLTPTAFEDNILADNTRPGNPLVNVHPRDRGYVIDPGESFLTPNERLMMPFPLNESPNQSTHRYYTWRDTAIRTDGGDPNNYTENANPLFGIPVIPPDDIFLAGNPTGIPLNSPAAPAPGCPPELGGIKLAVDGGIPAFAMPLLVDIRTYATGSASGLNVLDHSLAGRVLNWGAVNIGVSFRTFAAGGTNIAGDQVLIDPDLDDPSGGFNEFFLAPIGVGAATPPADEVFYMGQVDFVTRVSRAHSRWFNTLNLLLDSQFAGEYSTPVVFPDAVNQPLGTSVRVALRGASLMPALDFPDNSTDSTLSPERSAGHLDAFGDLPKTEGDLLRFNTPAMGGGQMPGGGGGAVLGNVTHPALFPPFRPNSFLYPEDDSQTYVRRQDRNPEIVFNTFKVSDPEGQNPNVEDDDWSQDPADIEGSQYFQFRLTFTNNVISGARPSVDAIGFAYDL